MADRGLIALLLLVTSCSGDACKGKAKRAEATAAPEAPVPADPRAAADTAAPAAKALCDAVDAAWHVIACARVTSTRQ